LYILTSSSTLAAALLFGKDEVMQQIIPHYKIDALLRVDNVERYDDRLYIQSNLIDAYEQLMSFVEGMIFSMELPIPIIQSGGAIEGLNEGLSEGLISLLNEIIKKQGIQAKSLSEKLNNRPIKTVERQIKTLIERGIIERRGSKKTGGYYIVKNKNI
jgi:predicted HTH transcriptional regulator